MACSAPQIDTQNANSSATAGSTSSSAAAVSRPPRFTMEGVGARVIRGPDWKWGKQVKQNTYLMFVTIFPTEYVLMMFLYEEFPLIELKKNLCEIIT